jgi:phthiodiolone/phenolphthiodiolone dimycocerosates ketoreductase
MTETAAAVWADRNVPIEAIAEQCKAYVASGAVDGVLIPDQLANFIPAQLWTQQNTPLAAMMDDPDSMMDAFMVAPYIAAVAPGLALHLTTDSVRRPPAELIQSMLTLAHITEGKATFQIGGGELKQTKPFGHPTNQGMSRMKDLFSMYEKFLTSDGPFDFEGRRRTLQGAFLGSAMHHKPKVWGLGGGPQLLDYTATWADGIAVAVPNAWTSPEAAEKGVLEIRRKVEEKGRDPAKFRIGLWAVSLMHDDERQLHAALDNPILKFVCGAMGRVETDQWQADGYDPLPSPTAGPITRTCSHTRWMTHSSTTSSRQSPQNTNAPGSSSVTRLRSPTRSSRMSTQERTGCARSTIFPSSATRPTPPKPPAA